MPENNYRAKLDRVLAALDAVDTYNGGQTRVARYPLGSEERARLVAEAQLYVDLLASVENVQS